MPLIRKTFFATTALLGLTLLGGGCLFDGYEGAFIEREDVSLDVPESTFRSSGVEGDIYALASETASDTNRWVAEVVSDTSAVVALLNQYRETSRDGDWRVYGPVEDDEGKDVAWMVRIAGDATFSPASPVTRCEAVSMISEAWGKDDDEAVLWVCNEFGIVADNDNLPADLNELLPRGH